MRISRRCSTTPSGKPCTGCTPSRRRSVYLLDERHGELRLALAGGSPPSLFTFAGRMRLDAPRATARAVQSGTTAVLIDPKPADPDQEYVQPYPYAALSAPVTNGDQRFGALSVLRAEDRGAFSAAERDQLEQIGKNLAGVLAGLVKDGVAVAAGPMPMLIPPEADVDTGACTPGWGVQGVPGSGGTSMMYPLRRLAGLLNRATAMEDIVAAAEYCVMTPLGAQALVLASAAEGRLWVLGHCGASSDIVRGLHGVRMNARTPATEAFRGRALFVSQGPSLSCGGREEQPHTEVYIPLTGDDQLIDLPVMGRRHVDGVCCLAFDAPRDFPPEERALLADRR